MLSKFNDPEGVDPSEIHPHSSLLSRLLRYIVLLENSRY